MSKELPPEKEMYYLECIEEIEKRFEFLEYLLEGDKTIISKIIRELAKKYKDE